MEKVLITAAINTRLKFPWTILLAKFLLSQLIYMECSPLKWPYRKHEGYGIKKILSQANEASRMLHLEILTAQA